MAESSGTKRVKATAAAWLLVDLPLHSPREMPVSLVVTAQTSFYATDTGYLGTVHFTAGDATVDLPPDYTFTPADAGTHTFSAVFHRGGHHSVNTEDISSHISGSDETLVVCPELTLTASNNGPICPGSTVTLTATTNAQSPSFDWTPKSCGGCGVVYHGASPVVPDGPLSNARTWLVAMTDSATGCRLDSLTDVFYEPGPDISAPPTASGNFTASIASDPRGPYTNISWTITGGTNLTGQGTPTITIHPDPSATQVRISVTATRTSSSCVRSGEALTSIVEPPLAEITTVSSACPNQTNLTASVHDAGPGTTYFWGLENATITSPQTGPAITFNAPAAGTIRVFVSVQKNSAAATGEAFIPVSGPTAVVTGGGQICAGGSATVTATLSGAPPFTINWNDGLVQPGVNSMSVTRNVTPVSSTSYFITSINNATCSGSGAGGAVVSVIGAPQIVQEPHGTNVPPGGVVTLTVSANDGTYYEWYEGAAGDTSRLVASGVTTFRSQPIMKPTSFWVRVSNQCGAEVASQTAIVGISGRRRAAGH